jgi:hypothetical protein
MSPFLAGSGPARPSSPFSIMAESVDLGEGYRKMCFPDVRTGREDPGPAR